MKKDTERKNYFHNKYRIPSNRLPGWDYSRRACYLVTVCTKNLSHRFGFIEDNKMILNDLGLFVEDSLTGLKIYKKEVSIINHIVMPNHVHLLLFLKGNTKTRNNNKFGPLNPNSLSSLINHFKGRITKHA